MTKTKTDIVDRLRSLACTYTDTDKAADEIERLRAENAELRELLRKHRAKLNAVHDLSIVLRTKLSAVRSELEHSDDDSDESDDHGGLWGAHCRGEI